LPFEIDYSKIGQKPDLYVCRPNLTIIGKLSDAFNIKLNLKLSQINELSFSLNYYKDINHKNVVNPNYNLLKHRYLIKFVLNDYVEYFLINLPEDSDTEDSTLKNISCFSLAYKLSDEIINGYKTTNSVNATTVLTDILSDTAWMVGHVDTEFDILFRQFDITGKSALDAIYDIANTFGALVVYNTLNYTVNFYNLETYGLDRGLTFKYGKYLKSINNTINPDSLCTQLYIYGKDNITISSVNTTGMPFLQNFTYFLNPFKRDENRNVLIHSDYMSDDLCHSILDFNTLLSTKEGDFNNLVTQKIALQEILDTSETDLTDLKTAMYVILDALDIAQSNGQDTSVLITNRNNKQIEIDNKYKEINSVLFDITITNPCIADGNINLTIDDKVIDIPLVLGDTINTVAIKINDYINSIYYNYDNKFPLTTTFKCTTINNIVSVIYFTTKDEADFNVTFTDTSSTGVNCIIGNKTNFGLENQINNINNQMNILTNLLSMSENFTSDQIIELKRSFIIKKEVRNEYISDVQELINWGKLEFEKIYKPPVVIQINIVDLFNCIDIGCQHDRNKLQLSEIVNISYDKFNVNVKAKINEIEYSFDDNSINVVISDVKEINKDKDKYLQLLNKTINAGIAVEVNKDSWNGVGNIKSDVNNILNNKWDSSLREILAGVSESVEINGRGITITNPNDVQKAVRLMHGIIALTTNGWNSLDIAIDGTGVYARKLIGQIVASTILTITNEAGNFSVDQNGVNIEDMSLMITKSDSKSRIIMNILDGIKIQKNTGTVDTPVWTDVFYVNSDGNIITVGYIEIGVGNAVFKADDNGIYLGNQDFNLAPFRVDLSGNAYMSKLTATNADVSGDIDCDTLRINGTNILDELNQKINGSYLANSSVGASKIKTEELVVGSNIAMGPNASITWPQVTSQPFIPSTAADVGARPNTWTPSASEVGAVANNQTAVFNTLTNNGALPGLFMSGGQLYINASYINAGVLQGLTVRTGATGETRVELNSNWGDINIYHAPNNNIFKIEDQLLSVVIYNPLGYGMTIGKAGKGDIVCNGTWDFTDATVNGVVAKFG